MKKVFLLMVISGLLATLGFAQTPDAGSNTAQANVKGCLGGSDGNYTVAEDGTSKIFKITTSSVDLKLHLGHDVKLVGHKASGAVSSNTADNSLAVTELSMISEHCTGAAAAPVATVSTSTDTVITPAAPAAAATAAAPVGAPSETAPTPPATPAATAGAPNASVNTPAAETSAPAATVNTPAAETSAPAATVNTPAAETSAPAVTVNTPAAATAHATRPSAHPRRQLATPAAAAAATPAATVTPLTADAATPAATASTHTADAATPAATTSTPSETDSAPDAAATTPTVIHKGGSLWLFIPFVVLLIALGTLVPLLNRWRKRKLLEQSSAQDLSLTHKPDSDPGKSDTPVVVRKAA